jgi:hypothetical protein
MTQFKDVNEVIKYFEEKHLDIFNQMFSPESQKEKQKLLDSIKHR